MSYNSLWTDPNNHENNLQSGDVLYESVIRHAVMEVLQWLGSDHVHKGREGDGPEWPIVPIADFKTLVFYNSVSWNGEDTEKTTKDQGYDEP